MVQSNIMGSNLGVKIAYLYSKLLNLYGDRGNIIALQKRCQWRNIKVEIEEINIGDEVADEYDIFFIGGGQDKQQVTVSKELQKQRHFFQEMALDNRVFLGICGGYQLFGKYYLTQGNEQLAGIGLLDVYTKASNKRLISNVCAKCNFIPSKTIVGFENHSGLTYIEGEATKELAKIVIGNGNNAEDKTEGARKNNVFGTYLHGSFLPKNPEFADYLLQLALNKKYNDEVILTPLDNRLENKLVQELSLKK